MIDPLASEVSPQNMVLIMRKTLILHKFQKNILSTYNPQTKVMEFQKSKHEHEDRVQVSYLANS